MTLENVKSSPAAPQSDGTFSINIGQNMDSEALETFLQEFKVTGGAAGTITEVYEDGTEDVFAAGVDSSKYLYVFRYSKANANTTTPKVKVFVAKGFIDPTSGGDDQTANAVQNVPIVFKTVKESTTGGLALPETEFESDLLTPAAKSLPEGCAGIKLYFSPPA